MYGGLDKRSLGRAPLGLIGMFVFVTLTESFFARHDDDFTNPTPANWRYSERESRRKTEPGMVLCFGTSLVKYGVLPRLIEQTTGHRAFNLAVCNGHMPSSYYLLKRSLDSGARPSAVVVDCQDGPVARDRLDVQAEALRVNLRQWPELLTWADGFDLAWTARDARFLADLTFSRLLPSYKARFEIRAGVKGALSGASGTSRHDILAVRRNWAVNQGAQVMPGNTEPPADLPANVAFDEARSAGALRANSRRNKLTEVYTDRFLSLAASREIPVLWALPPLAPARQADRDRAGITYYFTRQAERARANYPNVTVIDARRSGYASSAFWDDVHLDRRGAAAFSTEVGAVIRRVLAGSAVGRWVSLPDYREVPVTVAVEDVTESRSSAASRSPRVDR